MLEARMVNVDRCLKVLEIPQEQNKPADDRLNFFDARPDWPESGRVEFESVYLKYRHFIFRYITFLNKLLIYSRSKGNLPRYSRE